MTTRLGRRKTLDLSQTPPDFAVVTEEGEISRNATADEAAEFVRGLFQDGLCVWFEWQYDKRPTIARYGTEEEFPFVS